jgi:hypothetical protein
MRHQRGIADMRLVVIGGIVLLGLLYGLSHLWTSYIADVDKQGYDRGESTAMKRINERDVKALQDAIMERNAAQAMLDAAMDANKRQRIADNEIYRKGLKDEKDKYDRTVADVRSGKLVLFDPGKKVATVAGKQQETGDKGSVAGSGGPVASGDGDGRLSIESSELVLWTAAEADRLAKKVNELIKIVVGDRKQINGWDERGNPSLKFAASLGD